MSQRRSLGSSRHCLAPAAGEAHRFSGAMHKERKLLSPFKWSTVVLMWLSICSITLPSSQATCDLNLFETNNQGQYVCREHPDLVPALQVAEKMAREECERAFQWERWNCSEFSLLKSPNVTTSRQDTKEAAYVQALSLAAIAHSVAKACGQGEATSCSCDDDELDLPESGGGTTYSMGCSDNVEFGITFGREFLRRRHTGVGIRQAIEAHNELVGAHIVEFIDANPYVCQCVGVSGSCTIQTCQYELPEFSIIADSIAEKYFANHTCRAVWNPSIGPGSGFNLPQGCDRSLVYLHDSPDYCVRNPLVGSLGMVGRECDPHSTGHRSCNYLCTQCGRGHTAIEEDTESDCNCRFEFCCRIVCEKCPERRNYHVCT